MLVEGLRETDFGEWEGKTAEELQKLDPPVSAWMQGSGEHLSPPGGGRRRGLYHRVCTAFEQIVEGLLRTGTTSAVVMTHGGGYHDVAFGIWLAACQILRLDDGKRVRILFADYAGTLDAFHGGGGLCHSSSARDRAGSGAGIHGDRHRPRGCGLSLGRFPEANADRD